MEVGESKSMEQKMTEQIQSKIETKIEEQLYDRIQSKISKDFGEPSHSNLTLASNVSSTANATEQMAA